MSVAAFIMAAALTPPSFGFAEAKALVKGMGDIGQDEGAIADAEIVVQPDGHIRSCKVVNGWGDDATLKKICGQVADFKVKGIAKVDGKPAFGKFRTRLIVSEGRPDHLPPSRPDYTLTVESMPEWSGPQVNVSIVAHVAEDGSVGECSAMRNGSSPFVTAACRQLAQMPLEIVTDVEGLAVPYVTRVSMRFAEPDQAEDSDTK